jgi:transposase
MLQRKVSTPSQHIAENSEMEITNLHILMFGVTHRSRTRTGMQWPQQVICLQHVRGIDRFLDLGGLRRHLAHFYSHTGRPSIDPELMVRMLIVGYSFGIRSERRLCEEVHLNLAYRWFCRLGLEDAVPDHSTFSKNRHGRFRESEAFRHLFENVVERCMKEGLIGGEGFAVDASVIKADANRSRSTAREEAEDLRDPRHATRAVREYLATLDEQGAPATVSASISPTDPAARWTAVDGPAFYAYSTNYLIDLQAGIIVDVKATPAWRTAADRQNPVKSGF